jgi:mRNA-degrading endonuclease YafQ of YafQ-DinJ toxin-antitoxin module
MANIELYINQIKKLHPNIGEEELNKMVEFFKADMEKQEGRYRENELDGTYRELREGWVKVVPGASL